MLNKNLIEAYRSGKVFSIDGELVDFHSGINEAEAEMLEKAIKENKAVTSLEIGLAMGSSAITFCSTSSEISENSLHYAIDPNQFTDYSGVGVKLIETSGLCKNFKLIEGKTHEKFNYFIENNIKLDFAFVDGWHTFDYTLLDFFFIDKVLKNEGIIAFHDMYALSKQKVLRFILSHRDYEVLYNYRIVEKQKIKTLKFFLWRIYKNPRLLFSWYHWVFQTRSPYGIIFLRKKSSFEPNFDFYKSF